jgi:hypothetical protein
MDNVITETPILNYEMPETTTSDKSWLVIGQYLLILLILAFLGFNLFTHFGNITEYMNKILSYILGFLGYGVAETTKKIIDVSATGSNAIIDVAAETATGGIDLLEKSLLGKKNRNNDLTSASQPMPDDAGSMTQSSKAKNKSGYCYIGEDRGFRSCIQVGEGDMCMSGDIFPSQEICVNPSLRN